MKKTFVFVGFVVSFFLCYAQQKGGVQLSGTVTDAQTGLPLAGANIILSDAKIGTVTNANGYYVLSNITTGHILLEVSYSGYQTQIEHLDITGSQVKNFQLRTAIIESEGITVTAVAGATSIKKAPIPVNRVSKRELLSTPSTNIIDALAHQPGVNQLSTGPAISKPIIRGLGYNRLVVVNDGIKQEGQQWGDEHGIEIDENSVSRVEIVKGPASLTYGSDAIAGVINIITTQPVPNNTVRANILSGYQTNNKQRSLFASIGANKNGFNWNVWGTYKAAADYKNKYDGYVFNSKFNEKNVGGYGGYNGGWGFTHFIFSSFNQNLGVIEGDRDDYGRFLKLLPGGVEVPATDADFSSIHPQIPYQQVHHLKFITDNSFTLGQNRLTLNIGWQRNQRKEFGNADDEGEASLFFDLKTVSYNTALHFKESNNWQVTAGLNGMQQRNTNKGVEYLIPEYNLFDVGGFLYARKSLSKATLSGGVRMDGRLLHALPLQLGGAEKFADLQKRFFNFSGSVGLSIAASEQWQLKMNLARGFRAPSIPELASNGTHEGTNRYEYGNPDLKSETSLQGDLGVEFNSDHLYLSVSAFYNSLQHFIFYSKLKGLNGADSLVLVDDEPIVAYRFGQHNARLFGGELVTDLHPHPLDWLHWQNTFSVVQGRFAKPVEGTKNVPLIPAARFISELRASLFRQAKWVKNLTAYTQLEHTFKQNRPFTAFDTETPTPAYTLVNAGLSADVVTKKSTLFTLYVSVNNMADVAYQNHLSRLKYAALNPATGRAGVFNTGRNFSLKINIPLQF